MDDEPLIDFGVLEVSLAVTAIAFFLAERPSAGGAVAWVFLCAAGASLIFYLVYFVDLVDRLSDYVMRHGGSLLSTGRAVVVALAHAMLFFALFQGLLLLVGESESSISGGFLQSMVLFLVIAAGCTVFLARINRR